MSDSPNNIDPKEATEAKLCAYLEGELSPPERAEIEKYLDNNPQHRQLLVELATTRDFVRGLPRESAPPEIGELFQERLERSLLLDGGDGGSSGPITRVNRWPQVMLIAAMLLLACGLAVVIFFALPGRGPGPTQYSVATPPAVTPPAATPATTPSAAPVTIATATPSAEATVPVAPAAGAVMDQAKSRGDEKPGAVSPSMAAGTDSSKVAPPVATTPAEAPTVVAAATPAEADQPRRYDRAGSPAEAGRARTEKGSTGELGIASTGGFGGGGGGGAGASFGVANSSVAVGNSAVIPAVDGKALNERLARSNETLRKIGASANNLVCVVVSADDTNAAANQVRDYFVTNRIAYQPLPTDDAPAANAGGLALNNDGDAARTNAQSNLRRMKSSDAGFEMKKEPAADAGSAAKAGEAPKSEIAANNSQHSYNDYTQKIQPRYGTAKEVQEAEANGWAQSQAPAGQASNYNKSNAGYANSANNTNTLNYKDSAGNLNGNVAANGVVPSTQQEAFAQQSQQPQQKVLDQRETPQQTPLQTDALANANTPQQINAAAPVMLAENNDAFVATGLTRREAEQLSATLSTQRLGQTAAIIAPEDITSRGAGTTQFDFSDGTSSSTTMPAQRQVQLFLGAAPSAGPSTTPALALAGKTDAIRPDDRLTVTVAQLVGPGVDKTNTVKVAGDGKISLPMIEPVPAAGQTPIELEKQIAAKYRDANLITEPTVTVSRAAVAPTTSPTALDDEANASATTRPAGERAAGGTFALAATTQPAAGAEKVDVVVLVQKNPVLPNGMDQNAAPALQPATQPTPSPAK